MIRSFAFGSLTALLALLVAGSAVEGQENGREPFQATGTIRAVAVGAVQVATRVNELVAGKLPKKAS